MTAVAVSGGTVYAVPSGAINVPFPYGITFARTIVGVMTELTPRAVTVIKVPFVQTKTIPFVVFAEACTPSTFTRTRVPFLKSTTPSPMVNGGPGSHTTVPLENLIALSPGIVGQGYVDRLEEVTFAVVI